MPLEKPKTPVSAIGPRRYDYLDNLRSFVIFLVVLMHANATYSGYGRWYYAEVPGGGLDFLSNLFFGFYGSFIQAWFMGILFFLAAYFAARSLAKRGTAGFIGERLLRLGIPVLLFIFVVDPLIRFGIMDYGGAAHSLGLAQAYLAYIGSFAWVGAAGPLWFVEALLGFSLIYAAFRALRPAKPGRAEAPRGLALAGLVAGTALAAFAIRLAFPIGALLGNFLAGYFAAYVVLFCLGILAGERDWLDKIPFKSNFRRFWIVLALALPSWGAIMLASGADRGSMDFGGGWNLASLSFAGWESAIAIVFSLSLVAVFRRFCDCRTRATSLLAKTSFGVYVFHTPILVALAVLLANWPAPPLAKAGALALLGYALSVAFTWLATRVPGLRAVLK